MKTLIRMAIAMVVANSALATTLYWSGDGLNLGGIGTWNTTSPRWSTNSSGPFTNIWNNANVDTAFLDGTPATITVGAAVTVNKITNNVNGYTFATTSSKITFSGVDCGVDHNFTVTKLTLNTIGGATFTKTGGGRVELNNNANTVAKYFIFGGVLTTANTNKWGNGTTGVTNFLVLDHGAGWGIDSTSQNLSPDRGIYLNTGGGSLGSFNAGLVLTVYSRITGPGSLSFPAPIYSSAATWVLNNVTNDYAGSTFVKGGALRIGAAEVLPDTTLLQLTTGGAVDLNGFTETVGKVVVNSSTSVITNTGTLIATNFDLRASGTISAVLGGAAELVKTMSGSVTLNGANTYTGNTTNSAGNISINGTGRFGSGAGILTLSGGSITLTASRGLGATLQNPVAMTADTTIQNGNTGTGAILFRHGGTWNTPAGTLTIKNTTSTGAGSFDAILTNLFTFTQPIVIGASGDTLPCQLSSFNTTGEQTFSAEISGYGTFRRSVSSGAGGQTAFTADNTYSGGTIINAGTLLANNPGPGSATGTGLVAVSSSGTFGGTGIVASAVTVVTGGSINAGNSAGILTLQGGLNLSGGGTNAWELAAPKDASDGVAGTDWDQLALTTGGELDLSGNARLLLKFIGTATAPLSTEPFWQTNHSWTILTLAAPAANTTNLPFSTIANGAWNAGTFSNYLDGNGSIILTFTTNAPSLPVIASQPQSRTNNQGTTATFSVTAFGIDPEFYQWYFQNITNPIAGATSSVLTKTSVQQTNEGGYFVIITNSLGSATSTVATLTVIVPPAITAQPQGVSTNLGANVSFNAAASGTSPLYQWYFKGTSNAIAGATSSSLAKTNVQPADAGNYFVVVTNGAGSATSLNALLTVILPRPTLEILSGAGTTNVALSWNAVVGGSYALQSQTNLAASNWLTVGSVVASNTPFVVTNVVPAGDVQRYYRVLAQ